jgi:hypothetical protein
MENEEVKGFGLTEKTTEEYVGRNAPKPVEEPKVEPTPVPVVENPVATPPDGTPSGTKEPEKVEVIPDKAQPVVDAVDYKAEFEKLKAEQEKAGNKNPYANPNYYKLEVIGKDTPDELPIYERLVFGHVNDEDLLKLNLQKEFPEWADKPDKLQRELAREYPNLFNGTPADEQAYIDDKERLELKALRIRKDLMGKFNSIKVPDAGEDEGAKKARDTQQLAETWKPRFEQLSKELKFGAEITYGDGAKVSHEFEIPVAEQQKYIQAAALYALQNGLPASAESQAQLKTLMQRMYVAHHFQDLTSNIVKVELDKRDAAWQLKVNNPAKPTAAAVNPEDTGTAESNVDRFKKWAKQAH